MSTNDTPPLTDELSQEQQEQSQKAWNELAHHPLIRAFREAAKPAPHVHGLETRMISGGTLLLNRQKKKKIEALHPCEGRCCGISERHPSRYMVRAYS